MGNGKWEMGSGRTSISHFPFPISAVLVENNLLRALIQNFPPHFRQSLQSLDDREEVVAGQLSHPGREHHVPVGEDQLRLAVSAGVPEDLAGRRVTRVVLEA